MVAPPDGSLYDVETSDSASFGVPGPPLSRTAPFYRGFMAALGVLAAVAVGLALREASDVLELVLVSVFLAVGLNPIVEFGIRHGMRRGFAVLIVALLFFGVVALVVITVGGVLRSQLLHLIDDAPRLLNDLRHNRTMANLDRKYHIITDLQKKIAAPNFAQQTFGGIFNVGLSVLNAVASIVIVFVLTLYFLAALPTVKFGIYSLAPASRRDRVGHLGDEILRRLGRYVVGAFLVALLAGTMTLIFLFAAGLGKYALPLALLVALLDLVPLVGSISGAGIVTIVAFANGASTGLASLIFYVIYETLEGYVIYPRVMRSSIDVPEYVTIVAVLLGGAIEGVLGALLALPLAAALLLLVREVWVRRQDVA